MLTRYLTRLSVLRSTPRLTVALAFLSVVPALTASQAVDGVLTPVAVRAGSQTDPHISGTLISYTDSDGTHSAIHVYDLGVPGGNDTTIDPGAGIDQLAGISGNRVVYTHIESGTRGIQVYDTATHVVTVVDPQPGSDRRNAAIGGSTVAWVEYSQQPATAQVYVHDLATAAPPIRISLSDRYDTQPAVSPDGSLVAYTTCSSGSYGCDVVVYDVVSGTSTVIGTPATEERSPDLSNDCLVYAETDALGETDVVWVGLSGGATSGRFEAAGSQLNPSLSGDLIAFEGLSADNGSFDIYVLDIGSNELYRLNDTPEDEILNDVADGADGLIRAVWSTNVDVGDNDIYAFTFSRRPPAPSCQPQTAAGACADPTGRPLLAQLTLTRGPHQPLVAAAAFGATAGSHGVVCIANSGTTWGWVLANLRFVADPRDFGPEVTSIARGITLQTTNAVLAVIAGHHGVSYMTKVYGPREGCGNDDGAN